MSILSNIAVGLNTRKEHNNLSQDTHTTAEIGYFQPTFCRYLVPKSHFRISAKSLVRLSPLAVPTMGRISLRHYFSFVDLNTIWTPFEALRTGNNFTYADGVTQTPFSAPVFSIWNYIERAFAGDYLSTGLNIHRSFYCTVYKNGTVVLGGSLASELSSCQSNLSTFPALPIYYLQQANGNGIRMTAKTATSVSMTSNSGGNSLLGFPLVVNTNADFSIRVDVGSDTYMFLCRYTSFGKRLRKFFIGAGYSFNFYDAENVTPFKLLGIYKAWFDKFAVQRSINFNNTHCYKIMKYLSEVRPSQREYPIIFNTSQGYADYIGKEFISFIDELADLCYVLPPDYFSASDTTSSRGAYGNNSNGGLSISSINDLVAGVTDNRDIVDASVQNPVELSNSQSLLTGVGIELLNRAYRFVNKRSVVGRKISELLKLEGESDIHNNAHEQVHHLGSSRVDINISDVMSLADTSSASLGDYAGRGIGFKDSDEFVYDSPTYGFLLCLTAVVPTSGYFQGILKENKDSHRFDFFTEDYDAIGYQSLAMNELVSDFQFASASTNNPLGTSFGYLGVVPRYQHLRVGRNICNGDISCPSVQPVMLPYNIDRHFITRDPSVSNNYDFNAVNLPSVYPETFREVKADSGYGDYNRIFQYMSNDFDHFIIHIVFDCDVLSPLKSVRNAYDTFQDDDNKSMEVKHE